MAPSKQEKRMNTKKKSEHQPQKDNSVENVVIFNKVFTMHLANVASKASIIESRDALDHAIVQESLEKLKSDHQPTFAIITLLTRLAKNHVQNFNMDSMATLQTIAEQLEMEPVQVYNNHAKTLLHGFKDLPLPNATRVSLSGDSICTLLENSRKDRLYRPSQVSKPSLPVYSSLSRL